MEGYAARFLIGTEMPRIKRYDLGVAPAGAIEGPNEVAVRWKFVDAKGVVTEGDYADLVGQPQSGTGPSMVASNGNTSIASIRSSVCDGLAGLGGDLELLVQSRFYDETGHQQGYYEYYNGSVAGSPNCAYPTAYGVTQLGGPSDVLMPYVMPPGTAARIHTDLSEVDAIGNDNLGSDDLSVGQTQLFFPDVYYGASWCSPDPWGGRYYIGECTYINLSYPSIAPAYLAAVEFPNVSVPALGYVTVAPTLLDQYGFRLLTSGYTASGWSTGNASVSTAAGIGGVLGQLYGVAEGGTSYSASVNGVPGSVTVTVAGIGWLVGDGGGAPRVDPRGPRRGGGPSIPGLRR